LWDWDGDGEADNPPSARLAQRSRMVCIEETTISFTSASKSIISKEGYPVWS